MLVLQGPNINNLIVQCVHDTHKPLAYSSKLANVSSEHITLPLGSWVPYFQQPILWF
jgi:hypothetical protein